MGKNEQDLSIKDTNSLVFGLTGGSELIDEVCTKLSVKPSPIIIKRFADGEIFVKSLVSVRDQDLFIVQSTSNPVNENLMELLIAVDSFKRASAKSITAVIPYFGYARQDRKASGREPITAKLIADLLTTAGVSRIAAIDIHSEQEQGFFNIPVDAMEASIILFSKFLEAHQFTDFVIVAPDYGSVKRARTLSQIFNVPLAIVDKKRVYHNRCESISLLGEVDDKVCVIVDDMIDTAGTVIEAARLLKKNKAKFVYIIATHGLFNGEAVAKIQRSFDENIISEVWVSNSLIQKPSVRAIDNIKIVCLSDLISSIIHSYVKRHSLSHLYDFYTTNIAKQCKF